MTDTTTPGMTDRALRSPEDLDEVDFAKGQGLVPMMAQDARTGAVLMMAYTNREAAERTLETGKAWFWSRSRQSLWMKGESSGNTLTVVSLHADCDGDTLLALVEPTGPACHTGEATCFGEGASPTHSSSPTAEGILAELDAVLAQRAAERPEGSYTVKLLEDENLRLKKLGEETAELVAALAKGDNERAPEEAADLLYHLLAALRGAGLGLESVTEALEERRG